MTRPTAHALTDALPGTLLGLRTLIILPFLRPPAFAGSRVEGCQ